MHLLRRFQSMPSGVKSPVKIFCQNELFDTYSRNSIIYFRLQLLPIF